MYLNERGAVVGPRALDNEDEDGKSRDRDRGGDWRLPRSAIPNAQSPLPSIWSELCAELRLSALSAAPSSHRLGTNSQLTDLVLCSVSPLRSSSELGFSAAHYARFTREFLRAAARSHLR